MNIENRQKLAGLLLDNYQHHILKTKEKMLKARKKLDRESYNKFNQELRKLRSAYFDVETDIKKAVVDSDDDIKNLNLSKWCKIYPTFKPQIQELLAV